MHEAMERALKVTLIDAGATVDEVRRHGHYLHKLLVDLKGRAASVCGELERAFELACEEVAAVGGSIYEGTLEDYYRENFTREVFVGSRYAVLEGGASFGGNSIGRVNRALLKALSSIVIGKSPYYSE